MKTSTISIWSYILENIEEFKNSFFSPDERSIYDQILVDCNLCKIKIWEDFFMAWSVIYQKNYKNLSVHYTSSKEHLNDLMKMVNLRCIFLEKSKADLNKKLDLYAAKLKELGIDTNLLEEQNQYDVISKVESYSH